jgi:hypothetical protein
MPRIEIWSRLPQGIRDHLVERMRDRNIGLLMNTVRLSRNQKTKAHHGGTEPRRKAKESRVVANPAGAGFSRRVEWFVLLCCAH